MRPTTVLEMGRYLAPAYAGMVLAEQGCAVTRWHIGDDPLRQLRHGEELWAWVNEGKTLIERRAEAVREEPAGRWDAVIENLLPEFWGARGIDRAAEALRLETVWISIQGAQGRMSFDVVAQCQAWGELAGPSFYIGDTATGLWAAFKALAMLGGPGFYVVNQPAVLAKLVEGEETIERPAGVYPYDPDLYRLTQQGAEVEYRGQLVTEPRRDREWRLRSLPHRRGRFLV